MKQAKNSRLRQYFFVIRELTGRELKRKYSRSKLGVIWSVLQPLLNMIVLSLIFSQMFKRSIENFPVYYLCGSVLWTLFTTSTQTAMTALVDNKKMLIKVQMPMQVFVISRVYTAFINFIYSLIAFIPILLVFHVRLNATVVFLPFIVAGELCFCVGVSYILSVGYVFFGDVGYLYGILLTFWMYLSALFYPINSLPVVMIKVVANNPIYLYIDGMRWIVLEGVFPPVRTTVKMIIWSVLAYLLGNLIFRKSKNKVMQKL
ncbi:MAG: ABC transporter permease [Clostridium sp.]|nr:ABC transporter permease [Clostridium sp.]